MIAGGLKGHIGIEDMERRALAGGEGAYTDLVDEELPPLEFSPLCCILYCPLMPKLLRIKLLFPTFKAFCAAVAARAASDAVFIPPAEASPPSVPRPGPKGLAYTTGS